MSARHASWNMVTQQEIKVLVGFGCFFFFLFLKKKKNIFLHRFCCLFLQALLNDARMIAARRGRIPFEGDSNP